MDATGAVRSKGVMIAVGAIFATLALAPASAKEVKFPADKPKVSLELPDGWTTTSTPKGLELLSPEKNSLIVLQIVPHNKAAMQAWAEEAGNRLKAFGVAFKTDSKTSDRAPPTGASTPDTTAPAAPGASLNTAGLTKDANSFSFSGAPSVTPPTGTTPNALASLGGASIGGLAGEAEAAKRTRLSMQGMGYAGTTRDGKPVDTELVIFNLPNKQVLLMMQESDPDDNRSVAIARSVAFVK